MITIYTKTYCAYCVKAKTTLDRNRLEYKEILLELNDDFQKLAERTGHMTVPQIFVDDTFIGGSDDLELRIDEVIKMSKN